MGQILTCGAIIHSGRFSKATEEEQKKTLETLVNAGNKRSYLSLASYTFLIELLHQVCFSFKMLTVHINLMFLRCHFFVLNTV